MKSTCPPCPVSRGTSGWWTDGVGSSSIRSSRLQSSPPEVAEGERERHDGPGGEDQHGVPHVVEPGTFENHLRKAFTS